MAYPIWMDVNFTTTGETKTFQILDNTSGDVLFSGKATKFPGDEYIYINISRICENYLKNEIPTIVWSSTGTTFDNEDSCRTFDVYTDGQFRIRRSFFYCYNRSYTGNTTSDSVLSSPINGRYTSGMYCFQTTFYGAGYVRTAYSKNGGNGYVEESCGDYAIYYLNKNGGWDGLLIENKVVEKDKYDRSTYSPNVNNRIKGASSKVNYLTRINKQFEMHTPWLSDEQSHNLVTNLFSSPRVYVHDLKTNTVYAGNIANTESDYKTFKNEKTLISYQIDIDVAYEEQIR